MRHALLLSLTLLTALTACSSAPPPGPEVEYYRAAYRQSPPEPVYGRVTWSHLPQPIKPRSKMDAPLLMPTIAFEFPKSTLGETVQALAQAIGYTWSFPDDAAGRPIAIKMTATVDQVFAEILRQGNVYGVLDHDGRVVRIVSRSMVAPKLPNAALPNG
ncbi:MAG: hypothetical protein U0136_16955 [Bdellovibrionota bacterium]